MKIMTVAHPADSAAKIQSLNGVVFLKIFPQRWKQLFFVDSSFNCKMAFRHCWM